MPCSIALTALETGAGLVRKEGELRRIRSAEGCDETGAYEVGVDETEVGAADLRSTRRGLHTQRVAQSLNPCLGGCVGRHHRRVRDGRQRGDVEQVALAFCDLGDQRAVGAPHAEEVDGKRTLDLLDRRRGERPGEGDAGVGDAHVDRSEALDSGADGALQRFVVADIGFERGGAVTAELGRECFQALGLQADKRDVGALAVQAPRGLSTDAARRAGDEYGAAAYVVRSLVAGHRPQTLRLMRCPGRSP